MFVWDCNVSVSWGGGGGGRGWWGVLELYACTSSSDIIMAGLCCVFWGQHLS